MNQENELLDKIAEFKAAYPEIEIQQNKFGYRVVFYEVSYQRGIQVDTVKRSIYKTSSLDMLKNEYLTEENAIKAINEVLPEAETHFRKIVEKITALKKELNFNDDRRYIHFKMKGFDFTFEN